MQEFTAGITGGFGRWPQGMALLKWARRKNSIIVASDHDGEFHYEGEARPDAIQEHLFETHCREDCGV
jgi:DNA-binding transcriptional MocR family regulator